jgi:hypothetical protein
LPDEPLRLDGDLRGVCCRGHGASLRDTAPIALAARSHGV